MNQINYKQHTEIVDQMNPLGGLSIVIELQPDHNLAKLLADLSPDVAWGNRQIAARKLGNMRNPKALPGLVEALPHDPFWMVRCDIIQALEKIGDPWAIPALRQAAIVDSFQIVRSYAAKAIERLSQ